MDELKMIQDAGFAWPSPAYLFGALLFGIVGFAAYRYGKKTQHIAPRGIGLALMLYPYLISQTWLLYLVGAALCGALYFYRHD
jgi:hypothetical protein